MKPRNRVWRLGMAILVMVPVIWSSGQVASATNTAAPTGQITHMQWSAGAAIDKTMQDLARRFEQTHPGTKVNVTILPFDQYNPKITLLMAGNTAPDVFELPNNIMNYVQEHKVISLDPYILRDPILGNAKKSRVWANTMMKFDRKHIYGAQNGSLCSMQLYYNRTIFDKAHLAYPNTRWTWSDFLTTARKLTVRQGGKTVQWGADWGYLLGWDGGWQTLAASFGAKIMKTNFNPRKLYLNDPATIKAWQFMHDLVYKYKVAPTPAVDKALGQGGASPFQTGRIAMVPDGCWQLATYKTSVKLGMTLLPRGPVARVNPVWYAGGFMIPASSPNKPLAWEWLRWLAADKTANELMAKAGLNCGAPLVKTYDKLFSAAWATVPGGNACVKSLNHARYFQIYAPNLQQIFDNVINPNWDKFQHGKISARELAATLDREVNTALQSGGTMATSR